MTPSGFPTTLRRNTLRRGLALLLVVSQAAIATARHHHAGSAEAWLDESAEPQFVHEIACRASQIHWHADHVVEIEPCLACLRQHLASVQAEPPSQAVVARVETLIPAAPEPPITGHVYRLSSRGPPLPA